MDSNLWYRSTKARDFRRIPGHRRRLQHRRGWCRRRLAPPWSLSAS